MYEKGAAIRRQRQKEAAAWMEVNRGRIGIPSEIENCRIIGKLDHPIISDGWDNNWYRFDGSIAYTYLTKGGVMSNGGKDRFKSVRYIKRFENQKKYENCLKERVRRMNRRLKAAKAAAAKSPINRNDRDHGDSWTILKAGCFSETVPGSLKKVAERAGFRVSWPDENQIDGMKAKRQALREVAAGGLKKVTPLVGERIPKHLKLRKYEEMSERQQRKNRVMRIGDLFTAEQLGDMNPEEMIMDDKRLEIIAVEELWDLLRSNGLTVKEAEALDCRAYGQRSNSRLLMRGQMKARRILGGPIVIRSWKRPHVEWLHQLSACWVAV